MLQNRIANKSALFCTLSFNKLFPLWVGLGLVFLNFPSFANSFHSELRSQYLPLEAEWCLPIGDCILLEVADTAEEQKIGLMGRPSLHLLTGMWFQFSPPQIVSFWMHKTFIPLDMIFFSEGFIVAIETDLPVCIFSPCPKYGPNQLVDGVVELTAGEVERLSIEVGDAVDIKYKKISF